MRRAGARAWAVTGVLLTVLGTAGLVSRPVAAQAFDVRPGPVVLSGELLAAALTGLVPGARVEVTAERLASSCCTPGRPNVFRSRATFQADAAGRVDLAAAAPLAGTYAGADAAGLFWSMRLAPAYVDTAGLGLGRGRVRLTARPVAAGDTAAAVGAPALAATVVTLRASDPAVVVDSVPGFPGAVFAYLPTAPGAPPRPALIVLGGSEGGAAAARADAPRFASYGYAVLGLPYYSPGQDDAKREIPALPRSFVNIAVDRLEAARAWLARRPDVDVKRLGLYGVSKGAEFTLLAASRYPWVAAAAAIVPSDVVWEGWGADAGGAGKASSFAVRGRPLPFVPYGDMDSTFARIGRGEPIGIRAMHDAGRRAHPARAAVARIPVERYRGPLLVAGAGDDHVWASGQMAQAVAERRAEHGLATTLLVFPEAGHALSGDGWAPTTGSERSLGGTAAATAGAQRATWAATLAFFARALQPPATDRERAASR